jgi:hypothetical protein
MKSKLTINGLGTKKWRLPSGMLHREDGPAIEYPNGNKGWFINGLKYTEQNHKYKMRSIKLKLLLK